MVEASKYPSGGQFVDNLHLDECYKTLATDAVC